MFPSAPKKLGANCRTFRDQPPPETLAPSVPLNVSGPGVVGQDFISCHHANLVAKTRFHLCLQHSKSKEKLQIVSQNHWNSQMRACPTTPGAETRKGGLVLSRTGCGWSRKVRQFGPSFFVGGTLCLMGLMGTLTNGNSVRAWTQCLCFSELALVR